MVLTRGDTVLRQLTIFALCLSVCLLIPAPVSGQGLGSTTGTLSGEAKDEAGGPLPGVIVNVNGISGTKTATTDSEGKFIFPYLTPGNYNIRAGLQGFSTIEQNDVRISLGQRIEISFKMKPDVHESVTVTSESPLIDVTSTTIGANLSDQLTQRIPIGRSLADIIALAPGVQNGFIGGANLSISGGSGWENTYIIDGADVTNPGFGAMGNFAGNHGYSVGKGLPVDMIKEVQVKTGGFEPEYGQALGGIINVITKTGGNDFHGNGYIYLTPQSASNKITRGDYGADTGVDVGGPIIKNKLFFFGAYNLTRFQTTIFNQPDWPSFAVLPEVTNKTITNSYSMKFTADVASNHTVEFSASGDPGYRPLSNQDGWGLNTFLDPRGRQSEWRFGTTSQVLRWNGNLRPDMFLEAQVARSHNEFRDIPGSVANSMPRIVDHTTEDLDIGGFGGHRDFTGNNLQYSVKFTNLWKNQQFRYGLQLEDISFSQFLQRSGPPFTTFTGQLVTDGYRVDIFHGDVEHPELDKVYVVDAFLSPGLTPTTTNYLDWFAQDSWSLTPHLNVTLGVRWERQQLKGDREGATDVTFGNNWAPRIGVTYDYLKNGNSKVYFHFGRFFEKIPNYMGVLFTPSIESFADYSEAALTHFIPGSGIIIGSDALGVEGYGDSNSPFRTKAQFSNEWVGGIEREVKPGFSLGARFIFRNMNRVIENILINPDAPCVPYPQGGCAPSPVTVEELIQGSNFTYFITNVDGHMRGLPALVRNYKALEITAERRLSNRWQLLGSYRYAQLIGNYEGLYSIEDGIGIQAPNLTPSAGDFALSPFTQFNYAAGPLPNDIRHMVKLFSSYQWRNNLNTGIAFHFQTGRPITKLGLTPLDFPPSRLITPRGALGRTDSFASVDLHADYSVNVMKNQRVTFGLDGFNVFNSHGVTAVNETAEFYNFDSFSVNPVPNADFLKPLAFQTPRSIRLLLRYSF